ncbi:MAG: YceD family protein [Endomicrobiia bacterium]
MKISIDRIKKEKKVFLEYEDDQFKNKNFRESTSKPLFVSVILSLVCNNNVRVKGRISGEFVLVCDRCCDEFVQNKDIEIDEVFELEKKEISERMFYLDNRIRDVVLTQFPIKLLCKEDCKGICPGCGVNLNKDNCRCK